MYGLNSYTKDEITEVSPENGVYILADIRYVNIIWNENIRLQTRGGAQQEVECFLCEED